MKIVAIVGPSGSGKTRLMASLIRELKSRGLRVGAVKHSGHSFPLDVEGKDSRLFAAAGADGVAVLNPAESAVFRKTIDADLEAFAIKNFCDHDLVLIEGGKGIPGLIKIEVITKGSSGTKGIPSSEILAVVAEEEIVSEKPVFRRDQVRELADFLLAHPESGPRPVTFKTEEYFSKHDKGVLSALRQSIVGIAGAGGLGSNIAFSLARAGVGTLIIADFDRVETSNLNRQQFFIDQVGKRKIEALAENLKRINPFSAYVVHDTKLTPRNIPRIFASADLLIEAFDRGAAKQMLIETWLARFPGKPIIAASGLAGFGKNRKLHTRRLGNLYICGDEESECPKGVSPMAPRVALVANMQANLAVELLVKLRC